jgi:hypothetical protein
MYRARIVAFAILGMTYPGIGLAQQSQAPAPGPASASSPSEEKPKLVLREGSDVQLKFSQGPAFHP